MVLPQNLLNLFFESLGGYVQTCSKAEQLTLALYMNSGYYQTNLRKQRNLNARKIQIATETILKRGDDSIQILNNSSGLHMLLRIPDKGKTIDEICNSAAKAGFTLVPVSGFKGEQNYYVVMFYYTRIPIEKMQKAVSLLLTIL